MTLPDGLYDLLLTERLMADLDIERTDLAAFDRNRTELLFDVLSRQLASALQDAADDEPEPALRQVELVNALLVLMRQRQDQGRNPRHTAAQPEIAAVDLIATPPRVLRSIRQDRQFPLGPELGLAAPWLFTAGKGSPSLLQEIRKELASADQVDQPRVADPSGPCALAHRGSR